MLKDQLDYLDRQINIFSQRIEEVSRPFAEAIEQVARLPGFQRVASENVIAEIGCNMDQFPSSDHLSSWAGVCSGSNESAGKRKSGKTTKGSKWLRATLTQAGWAASRKRNSYFHAQYGRLAGRRGKKRALIAVAHSLLTIIYHVLKKHVEYKDLSIVPGAVMPVPRRMTEAEEILKGRVPDERLLDEASRALSAGIFKTTGLRWSTEYKLPVIMNVFKSLFHRVADNDK